MDIFNCFRLKTKYWRRRAWHCLSKTHSIYKGWWRIAKLEERIIIIHEISCKLQLQILSAASDTVRFFTVQHFKHCSPFSSEFCVKPSPSCAFVLLCLPILPIILLHPGFFLGSVGLPEIPVRGFLIVPRMRSATAQSRILAYVGPALETAFPCPSI